MSLPQCYPLSAGVLALITAPALWRGVCAQVLLRMALRSREELLSGGGGGGEAGTVVDMQAELRQKLLDCLRTAPTMTLRQNEGLQESMEELLRECKAESKYDAAAKVQDVLELFKQTGVESNGEAFLRTTADEISKRARRRVQLVKERKDLQKIVEFVQTHKQELKRKHAAYGEYLEAVREARITVKNVYTNEKRQRMESRKKKGRKDDAAAKKEEEERKKNEAERVRTVMSENPTFGRIIEEDAALAKYIEAHPNLTQTQFRDLLDRRPEFVHAFDKHPEELMKVGRAPALHLMLNQHKELKAALDKKQEVREILESKPDLTRNDLNELVHTNAQLKDLYDSRPELKELLQQRAKLFEDDQKRLEDQKADAFVAGPMVSVSAKLLEKEGVLTTISLPPKMISQLKFEFMSVKSGSYSVLAMHKGRSVFLFELRLEEVCAGRAAPPPSHPATMLTVLSHRTPAAHSF